MEGIERVGSRRLKGMDGQGVGDHFALALAWARPWVGGQDEEMPRGVMVCGGGGGELGVGGSVNEGNPKVDVIWLVRRPVEMGILDPIQPGLWAQLEPNRFWSFCIYCRLGLVDKNQVWKNLDRSKPSCNLLHLFFLLKGMEVNLSTYHLRWVRSHIVKMFLVKKKNTDKEDT
jgi:hypothetical protein